MNDDKHRQGLINALRSLRREFNDGLVMAEALDAGIEALEWQRGPIKAKPIEWERHVSPNGAQEWDGSFGFVIEYDAGEDLDFRYSAVWGEEVEHFGTLAEAQEWCQHEADALVASMAAPTPQQDSGRPVRPHRSGGGRVVPRLFPEPDGEDQG